MNPTPETSLVHLALQYIEGVVSICLRTSGQRSAIETSRTEATNQAEHQRSGDTETLTRRLDKTLKESEATKTRRTKQAIETSTTDLKGLAESTERQRLRILDKSERVQSKLAKRADRERLLAESLYELKHMDVAEQHRLAGIALDAARLRCEQIHLTAASTDASSDAEPALVEIADIESMLDEAERLQDSTRENTFRRGLRACTLGIVAIGPGVAAAAITRTITLDMWAAWAGAATLLGVIVAALLHIKRKRWTSATLRHAALEGHLALDAASHRFKTLNSLLSEQEGSAREDRNTRLQEVRSAVSDRLDQVAPELQVDLEKITKHADRREDLIKAERAKFLSAVTARHKANVSELEAQRAEGLQSIDDTYKAAIAKSEQTHQEAWDAMQASWQSGLAALRQLRADAQAQAEHAAPAITTDTWESSPLLDTVHPEIVLGHIAVSAIDIPPGPPDDPRLPWTEPATTNFDIGPNINFANYIRIECASADRAEGVRMLQTCLFRLITSLPPAMLQLMLADPVGLGETFAGFMHLADYDDAVVSRVWSEPKHIEEQLGNRTEHMERVIQTFLRDEFETLAEYNRNAGAIAERYHAMVLADYPTGLNAAAAKRLESIMASGGRCGVLSLILCDLDREIPEHLEAADRIKPDLRLRFENGQWKVLNPPLADFAFTPAQPAPTEATAGTLHRIGEAAGGGNRVEVPFSFISPNTDDLWTRSTKDEVRVGLGQTGANRFLELKLGRGTTQHALIAGRTGSGKSTLLHVLITNLAMWYSPDEIEFHLVDFKKGVEFQTYALNTLPHARVVAIESDREFGLSVLRKLDQELRRRGDLFREANVQDLGGWRSRREEIMPRVLLIVDEFQEFFVNDDALAQEAGLLLDRLVRQGRAFGMHILMGSQTLDGAFSLARSTLGQMGVRVALQCTESDSYLILSEDNPAARMLRRPGDAIYNDAGGKLDGNTPFQVVWLDDTERDVVLDTLKQLDADRYPNADRPLFVFRGNIPSQLSSDEAMRDRLAGVSTPNPAALELVLGDPIAITEQTRLTLRPRSGCNALLIGQHAESANALLTAAMMQAAADLAPTDDPDCEGLMVWLLDGAPPDALFAGRLASLGKMLPHQVTRVTSHNAAEEMQRLSDILHSRGEGGHGGKATILIIGLEHSRLGVLRPSEDDFSFSNDDAGPKPDRQLADILQDGPVAGIHSLLWLDGLNNLNRGLSRASQREFDAKVLFQMGGNDSGQLIDSTAATDLGPGRALLFTEEFGSIEKFRPWAMPDDDWLAKAAAQIRGR
jgi:S-DNA-T family DNA segregation ATPase FtsK/SpoIIIE